MHGWGQAAWDKAGRCRASVQGAAGCRELPRGLCPGQGWHCPWGAALPLSSWHLVMAPAQSPSPPLLVPHAARWAPFPLTAGPMEAAVPICTTQSPLSPTFPTVSSPKSALTVAPNRGHAPAVLLGPVPPSAGCSALVPSALCPLPMCTCACTTGCHTAPEADAAEPGGGWHRGHTQRPRPR